MPTASIPTFTSSGIPAGGAPPTRIHISSRPAGSSSTAPPASTFTLNLTATVVSVRAESLRVRVHTLRANPYAITLRRLNRTVTRTVPGYATVERGANGASAVLTSAKRGLLCRRLGWSPPSVTPFRRKAGQAGCAIRRRASVFCCWPKEVGRPRRARASGAHDAAPKKKPFAIRRAFVPSSAIAQSCVFVCSPPPQPPTATGEAFVDRKASCVPSGDQTGDKAPS